MLAQYFPVLWIIVAAHIVLGVVVVIFKVKPRIDSGEIPDIEGSGFAKLLLMFQLYGDLLAKQDQKGWDYYYARAFKFLHLIAMAIIVVVIIDVGWRQLQDAT